MSPTPLSRVLAAISLLLCAATTAKAADLEIREYATFLTSAGSLDFELFSKTAPRTVQNFKFLADTRFYTGTAFHRIMDGFMAQGGDPYTRGTSLLGVKLTSGTNYATCESYNGLISPGSISADAPIYVSGYGIPEGTTLIQFNKLQDTETLGRENYSVVLSNNATQSTDWVTTGGVRKDKRGSLRIARVADLGYGSGGIGYTIPSEFGTDSSGNFDPSRSHGAGVLSMARGDDPNSAGSGFFIVLEESASKGVVNQNVAGLDRKYASFAKLTPAVNNTSTLERLRDKARDAISNSRGEISQPRERIVVRSIKITSSLISGTLSTTYPSGTFAGLLRSNNRQNLANENILGTYSISLNGKGSLSGQITYFGRQATFAGNLTAQNPPTEYEFNKVLDSASGVPLNLTVHLRRTSNTDGNLSVIVCSQNPDGTDNLDTTFAAGGTDLTRPNLSAERYTTTLYMPITLNGYFYRALSGYGFMSIRYSKTTGICQVTAKLPNNRAVTYSNVLSSEGGRNVLPIFVMESAAPLQQLSKDSSKFTAFPLFRWSMVDDSSNESFSLRGGMEMKENSDIRDSSFSEYISNSRYLYWLSGAQTTGPVRYATSGVLLTNTSPWNRPASQAFPAPFVATSGTANIQVGTVAAGTFTLSKSTGTATFRPNANALSLKLDTTDGTFSGTFLDKSKGTAIRRTFQGVCLGGGSFLMRGFYTDETSVKPVDITIPLPQ